MYVTPFCSESTVRVQALAERHRVELLVPDEPVDWLGRVFVREDLGCRQATTDGVDSQLPSLKYPRHRVRQRANARSMHVLAEQPISERVNLAGRDGELLLRTARRSHGASSEISDDYRLVGVLGRSRGAGVYDQHMRGALRAQGALFIDSHLMINEPQRY